MRGGGDGFRPQTYLAERELGGVLIARASTDEDGIDATDASGAVAHERRVAPAHEDRGIVHPDPDPDA